MTTDTETSLKYFYIFNSSFGQIEGEEEQKIFYFYPAKTDIDTQVRSVGLIEAIIKFTETFNCDSNYCGTLHTQQTRQLYYQPEQGFWMVMVLNIPSIAKTKDGVEYMETQNEDVQDNVYQAVLRQVYEMFRLFNGTFLKLLNSPGDDMSQLKQKLDQFMSMYLTKLQLQYCDILNIFQGVQFLPLNKQAFLHVQCVVKLLECLFPTVKYTAFLYNDQLIWSGLEPNDMQVVYRYLVTSLLPAQIETEIQGNTMPRHSLNSMHYGRFATGPPNLQEDNLGKIPKVHLCCNEPQPKFYHLVVYRALSASVCLFIDGTATLDMEFFKGLDVFLGTRLPTLASEVAEQCGATSLGSSSSTDPRFVYYNHFNRAQKSTVHLDNRQSGNIAIPTEVLRIFSDVNADFSKRNPPTAEIMVRTMNDYWVVGKMSNLREFYVVIHQKNYNFIQIHEEVRKLCDTQFKSIFFND